METADDRRDTRCPKKVKPQPRTSKTITPDAELIVLLIGTETLLANSGRKTKLAMPNMPHKSQADTARKINPIIRKSDPVFSPGGRVGRVLAQFQVDPRKNKVIRPQPTPNSAGIMVLVVPINRQGIKSTVNITNSQNKPRPTLAVRAAPMTTMNAPRGTDHAQIMPNRF